MSQVHQIANFSSAINTKTAEATTLVKSNPITLLTDQVLSEDAPRLYSIIINALTAATVTNTMKHLYNVRYGRHAAVPHSDIPHLDERNEQDENARGAEVEDAITRMQGFNPAENPLKLAQICDGIRYALYDELHAFGEFDEPQYLVRENPVKPLRVNYNQPMSAEKYLDFRIEMADKLNENEIALSAKRLNKPVELIRAALLQEALRNKQNLISMRPDVLTEITSFDDVYDATAFTLLDMETQCGIMQKVGEKLDAAYMRLLPRAVRSLEFAAELERIERMHNFVKRWLQENDDELQAAMALRKSLMA